MSEIKLGDKVKDRVSGFTGIATARHEYINGCVRLSVSPPVDEKGALVDDRSFDVQQLEVIEAGAVTYAESDDEPAPRRATGGPQSSRPPARR